MSETTTTVSEVDDADDTEAEKVDNTELEDLQKAILVLKHLRKENRQLAKNFDNLKSLHVELVARHRQLEVKHDSLGQERVSVERQYQQLCESWRAELEEKQRQFEQARAQILEPRDLDLLRVQLLEEVEAPFRAKCDALSNEAEAAQRQFVQLRRQHEALQNKVHNQEQLKQGELELLRAEHKGMLQQLADKILALDTAEGRAQQLQQQVCTVQQQKDEATLQLHFLQDEVQELRKAKEAAVVEKEQLAIRLERRSKQQQVEITELHSLVESLMRKNKHLAQELTESNKAHEAAHTQLIKLQASNASLASQVADARAIAAKDRQLQEHKAKAAEQQWQARINDLLAQVLQKELQLAQAAVSEQHALQQAEVSALAQLTAAQEAATAREREAAAQAAELSAKLEAAEATAAELQAQLLESEQKLHQEVTATGTEAQHMKAQLESSQQLVNNLEQQLADALGKQQQASRRSTSDTANGPQSDVRCLLLEQQCQQLGQQLADANKQLAGLQQQQVELRVEADKRVNSVRQATAADKDAMAAKYATKIRKLQQAAKEQVRALRAKLTESYAAIQELNSELSSLRISLRERDAELSAVTRQSYERSMSPAGSPLRLSYDSPARLQVAALALQQSPLRASLASAMAGVRQRQQQYLEAVTAE